MDKRDIENFPKIRKKHKSKTTNFYENLEQKNQILGKFGRNPIDYGSFSEEESVNLATPNSVRFLFLLVFPLLFYVIIKNNITIQHYNKHSHIYTYKYTKIKYNNIIKKYNNTVTIDIT